MPLKPVQIRMWRLKYFEQDTRYEIGILSGNCLTERIPWTPGQKDIVFPNIRVGEMVNETNGETKEMCANWQMDIWAMHDSFSFKAELTTMGVSTMKSQLMTERLEEGGYDTFRMVIDKPRA